MERGSEGEVLRRARGVSRDGLCAPRRGAHGKPEGHPTPRLARPRGPSLQRCPPLGPAARDVSAPRRWRVAMNRPRPCVLPAPLPPPSFPRLVSLSLCFFFSPAAVSFLFAFVWPFCSSSFLPLSIVHSASSTSSHAVTLFLALPYCPSLSLAASRCLSLPHHCPIAPSSGAVFRPAAAAPKAKRDGGTRDARSRRQDEHGRHERRESARFGEQ